jgi:hypothetical protein
MTVSQVGSQPMNIDRACSTPSTVTGAGLMMRG